MHPSIAAFPAVHFYEGELLNGEEVVNDRPPMVGFRWPTSTHQVCFVDCGPGLEKAGSRSRVNVCEATALMTVLQRCLDAGVPAGDIAVITGYSAQKALLQQHADDVGIGEGLKIDTVDGFQGAERDLVLVSTVRANISGEVGFMRDPRRVNVLLTRARRGLIVFGDSATLGGEAETWRPWLQWVWRHSAVVPVAEVMSQEPFPTSKDSRWTRFYDPASGRAWLWNEASGESCWDIGQEVDNCEAQV
jgi:superfamily I DNA and/or RNA helicase